MADADPSPIVGLGTLQALKEAVLPESLVNSTDTDKQLSVVGKGALAMFENFTNRKFPRVENGTIELPGGGTLFSLPRYPVERVSKIEVAYYGDVPTGSLDRPFTDYTADTPSNVNKAGGFLEISYVTAGTWDTVRLTYTGGYWIDPGDGSECPEGATPVPPDLFNAWTLQVASEIQARDILGVGVVRDAKEGSETFARDLGLIPQVRATLETYRRFA